MLSVRRECSCCGVTPIPYKTGRGTQCLTKVGASIISFTFLRGGESDRVVVHFFQKLTYVDNGCIHFRKKLLACVTLIAICKLF